MRKMVILTLALVLAMALIGCASAVDSTNDHVIQVSGTGSVTGTPDRVQISFAVETDNPDVKIAQANNAVAMNNVVDTLAAAGIPPGQMKTADYSITPVYQTDNNGIFSNTITTYQVTNTLQITLRDTNTTGQVIDTAVAAGANQVNSIQFMLSDEQAQALRSQALSRRSQTRGPMRILPQQPSTSLLPAHRPLTSARDTLLSSMAITIRWRHLPKPRQLRRRSSQETSRSPPRYPSLT